jgi:hypothetical protein
MARHRLSFRGQAPQGSPDPMNKGHRKTGSGHAAAFILGPRGEAGQELRCIGVVRGSRYVLQLRRDAPHHDVSL